jgi:plasmid stabilization system protein ParE
MSEEFHILLQPEAVEGMESAYRWIEGDSPRGAHKWVKGLMEAIESLKFLPRRCALAPENEAFEEEVRQLLYGKRAGVYRILFTVQQDTVNVVHIHHSAQQWVTPEAGIEDTVES